jgi:hypothetical protein
MWRTRIHRSGLLCVRDDDRRFAPSAGPGGVGPVADPAEPAKIPGQGPGLVWAGDNLDQHLLAFGPQRCQVLDTMDKLEEVRACLGVDVWIVGVGGFAETAPVGLDAEMEEAGDQEGGKGRSTERVPAGIQQ